MENTSANEFDAILLRTNRPGMSDLLEWLHSTDFYEAPASTKYHGAVPKGLIYHSLGVHDCAEKITNMLADVSYINYTKDELAIASLLHDICKANCYTVYQKNVKKDGVWVQEDAYKFDEQLCFGGHGSKSVYLAQRYITLTTQEAIAINCHMGFTDSNNLSAISNAYQKCHLAWVLHVADEMSTFICDL